MITEYDGDHCVHNELFSKSGNYFVGYVQSTSTPQRELTFWKKVLIENRKTTCRNFKKKKPDTKTFANQNFVKKNFENKFSFFGSGSEQHTYRCVNIRPELLVFLHFFAVLFVYSWKFSYWIFFSHVFLQKLLSHGPEDIKLRYITKWYWVIPKKNQCDWSWIDD